MMKVGTKSVLFGAHCFFIHPFFVAYAWWKIYGFPFDPRLWIAFFVHDLGYIGKPNMDGEEGELHPYLGAKIMGFLFDRKSIINVRKWYYFTLYHSRYLAKKNGGQYSKLCVADKYCIAITPYWIYLPMVNLTGEIKEYLKMAEGSKKVKSSSQIEWYLSLQQYMREWVEEHKELKEDNWTSNRRAKFNEKGVWL